MKESIYSSASRCYERESRNLEKSDISDRNKELIRQWQKFLLSSGCGNQRVGKLTLQMRKFLTDSKQELDRVTKPEMESAVARINADESISSATQADYRRMIKQFYKWFKAEDPRLNNQDLVIDDITLLKVANGDTKELPELMLRKKQAEADKQEAVKLYDYIENHLRRAYKLQQIDASEVITDEDMMHIVEKGCSTYKEKAFISLLHETGARIGEFLNIRLCDINIKGDYFEINLDGKTGKRTVFCYNSLPYLVKYLDIHKNKDDNSSHLWLTDSPNRLGKNLKYIGACKLIKRCFEKAKVSKKHNLHWFRHSRATILANKITEPQLRKYMGWSKDSRMIKHYGHLSNKDIENVMLNLHGLKKENKNNMTPQRCICGTLNPYSEKYCFKCSRPLKMETLMQDKKMVDTELSKTVRAMMDVFKNPDQLKAFEEYKRRNENEKRNGIEGN